MERLNLEQLARLVDEPTTPEEQTILDRNPELRRELEALRSQTAALGNLPAVLPPPGGWHELEGKLRSAGLIRDEPGTSVVWRKWLQLAAAVLLFIGGTAFGWAAASGPGILAGTPPEIAGGPASVEPASFASLDEARLAVQAAEEEWTRAYTGYRRLFDAENRRQAPQDPARRLAALESLVAASQQSVAQFPADQFLNSFLNITMFERQQVLRQISQDNWH